MPSRKYAPDYGRHLHYNDINNSKIAQQAASRYLRMSQYNAVVCYLGQGRGQKFAKRGVAKQGSGPLRFLSSFPPFPLPFPYLLSLPSFPLRSRPHIAARSGERLSNGLKKLFRKCHYMIGHKKFSRTTTGGMHQCPPLATPLTWATNSVNAGGSSQPLPNFGYFMCIQM